MNESSDVINITKKGILKELKGYTKPYFPNFDCSKIEELKLFVAKEKLLYNNWGRLIPNGATYTGKCWIP